MSIIHEALKKAGRDKETGVPQRSARGPLRENLELQYEKKKTVSSWSFVFTGLAAVLIVSPMLATYFATPRKTSTLNAAKNPLLAQAPANTASRKAQFGVEELPLMSAGHPAALKQPNLSLTGVVYSSLESYCIINNKIVKIGETVDGAKLLSISQTEVALEYKGEKIILAVGD